jgi:hypothetical protein
MHERKHFIMPYRQRSYCRSFTTMANEPAKEPEMSADMHQHSVAAGATFEELVASSIVDSRQHIKELEKQESTQQQPEQ